MVVIEANSTTEDSRHGKGNEHEGAIEEDGWDPKANFATSVEICEYAITSESFDVNDVFSSISLELENQAQDQIKEEESTVEVDQSGIGSSPQEVPKSKGLRSCARLFQGEGIGTSGG
ncbi:hypothetical protein AAC387_Pa07g1743 [Persea americana]